jgi:geranylgeranyl diphosphate synthase type II
MKGMVGGQIEDLAWERRKDGTVEALEALHRRKTGALFRASLRLGGLIGTFQTPPAEAAAWLAALDRYAGCLGLAFQIADDLLDVEGRTEQTGKGVQKDAARGKLTFPGLLGIAESRRRLQQLGQEAQEHLTPLGEAARFLAALIQLLVARDR